MYCSKVDRARRITFEFLAQLQNAVGYRSRARIICISPDFIEQLVSRDDAPSILNEVSERLKFLGGEDHGFAFSEGFPGRKIDGDIAERDRTPGSAFESLHRFFEDSK
jgi:hypothetical protein